jgi:hypothetical protein
MAKFSKCNHISKYSANFQNIPVFVKIFLLMLVLLNLPEAYAISEKTGMGLYYKLADGIVKIALVFKGGFEVLQACLNGDFQTAKKNLIGYLLAFASIYLLPSAFDEIQNIFGR